MLERECQSGLQTLFYSIASLLFVTFVDYFNLLIVFKVQCNVNNCLINYTLKYLLQGKK